MPKSINNEKMEMISIHIPKQMLEQLDQMVKLGIYPSRSEAIRAAVREFLKDTAAVSR
jgi:antitoxin ParD1/3/4